MSRSLSKNLSQSISRSAKAYGVQVGPISYDGLLTNANEVASLPTSGAAWTAMLAEADKTRTPDIANQDDDSDIVCLARALVWLKTGTASYRTGARDLIMAAIDTEDLATDALAASRNIFGYVVAADTIGLDGSDDTSFRSWLSATLDQEFPDGRTVRTTHADRPNNWGLMAGASRVAAASYLGLTSEVETCSQIFHGWLGNRSVYTFDTADYGGPDPADLSWQADAANPVGINPIGSTISGNDVSGVLPDEQRRSGSFSWPPPAASYVHEGLQAVVAQAIVLHRLGYNVWNWEHQAIKRAFDWVYAYPNSGAGYPPTGDDSWMTYAINHYYGTSFSTESPSTHGKQMGYTDWLYG